MESPSPSASASMLDAGQLLPTILEVESGYVPEYVTLRSRITESMLTVDVTLADLTRLESDPKIKTVSLARQQRPISDGS